MSAPKLPTLYVVTDGAEIHPKMNTNLDYASRLASAFRERGQDGMRVVPYVPASSLAALEAENAALRAEGASRVASLEAQLAAMTDDFSRIDQAVGFALKIATPTPTRPVLVPGTVERLAKAFTKAEAERDAALSKLASETARADAAERGREEDAKIHAQTWRVMQVRPQPQVDAGERGCDFLILDERAKALLGEGDGWACMRIAGHREPHIPMARNAVDADLADARADLARATASEGIRLNPRS